MNRKELLEFYEDHKDSVINVNVEDCVDFYITLEEIIELVMLQINLRLLKHEELEEYEQDEVDKD